MSPVFFYALCWVAFGFAVTTMVDIYFYPNSKRVWSLDIMLAIGWPIVLIWFIIEYNRNKPKGPPAVMNEPHPAWG